jgi:hypothetical protein
MHMTLSETNREMRKPNDALQGQKKLAQGKRSETSAGRRAKATQ